MNQEYNKIIEKIGFKTKKIISVIADQKLIAVGEMNGNDVLLKIIRSSDKKRAKNYRKELEVDRILEEGGRKIGKNFKVTQVIEHGEDDGLFWVVKQYVEASPLSSSIGTSQDPLFGYDDLGEARTNPTPIIEGISEFLSNLRSLHESMRDSAILLSDQSPRYPFELRSDYVEQVGQFFGNHKIEQTVAYYDTIRQSYRSPEIKSFCLGDLVPPNILLKPDGGIVLIDFEWFGIDNYMSDVAFFWLFLHRYPDWQKILVKKMVGSEEDRVNFRASLIRQVINSGWHDRLLAASTKQKPFIWYRYLKAAGESFEAIMKVK